MSIHRRSTNCKALLVDIKHSLQDIPSSFRYMYLFSKYKNAYNVVTRNIFLYDLNYTYINYRFRDINMLVNEVKRKVHVQLDYRI